MAETEKKATAAKPRKAAAKKTIAITDAPVNGSGSGAQHAEKPRTAVSHDDVAVLAHRFWNEGGQQHGHHVEDWLRAEEMLRGKAS
jgi:hypothetical protein